MMATIKKTNAARILDRKGIAYALSSYPVDENDLSAMHAASLLGVDPQCIYKTLFVKIIPMSLAFAVIPAPAELDLKKLAAAFGGKSAEMMPLKDLFTLTGYMRGGCSPLGAKKNYPVCIDESALQFAQIYVSAGQRGVQLVIAPNDLAKAASATVADIVR